MNSSAAKHGPTFGVIPVWTGYSVFVCPFRRPKNPPLSISREFLVTAHRDNPVRKRALGSRLLTVVAVDAIPARTRISYASFKSGFLFLVLQIWTIAKATYDPDSLSAERMIACDQRLFVLSGSCNDAPKL